MEVRSVETIVGALNEANVQYLIVGGIAVNAHGYERLTDDVDVVIGLEPKNIEAGLNVLSSIGYRIAIPVSAKDFADPSKREKWRMEKGMVILKLWSDVHRRTPIDVFVYEPFDFKSEYVSASWLEVAAGVKAPIIRYETLVRMKKEAARPQDLVDLEALERIQNMRDEDRNE